MMFTGTQIRNALGLALVLTAGILQAAAAPPAAGPYTFSCTPLGGTASSFSVAATGYSFQTTSGTIGSQSDGAGAGKVTYNPFTVELPAVQFTASIYAALETNPLSTCTLTPTNGKLPGFTFAGISLTGVSFRSMELGIGGSGNVEIAAVRRGSIANRRQRLAASAACQWSDPPASCATQDRFKSEKYRFLRRLGC